MKNKKKKYSLKTIVAAVVFVLSLLWLTVSIPFVYAAKQQLEASATIPSDDELPGSDNNGVFGNSSEEKAESGNSLSEYLHHIHDLSHPVTSLHTHNCSHEFSVYVAFHGELLCPPPNFIL